MATLRDVWTAPTISWPPMVHCRRHAFPPDKDLQHAVLLRGTTNYGYDPLTRLISEGSTRQGGYSNSFAYDAAGNPTTFRNVDPTGGAGYNADNQNGNGAFTYDGEGNPTLYNGIGSQNFDAEDRPTHVQTAVSGEANGWRVDGLRGWKQGAGDRI